MYEETTIAAIATSPGEGGIGIIRISGIDACCIADKIFQARGGKFAESTPYLMRFGHVVRGDKTIVDEGLAVFMKAPHSYTGEDVVEIQIHGSMEALRQTLALVLENGAVPAARGEFTKRAFLNGRLDLTQAEAVMDVIEAKGAAALSQAESHLSGKLSSFVHTCRDELTDLITKLEVTIDYPEEDLEDLTNEQMEEGLVTIQKSLADLLQRSEEGRIIKDGLRTAIVGRPNAGKSSLLNALLQEDRAIVTDIPGTTRDTIEESIKIGGVPLVLMDTAGLRETDNRVEQIGIERARASMEKPTSSSPSSTDPSRSPRMTGTSFPHSKEETPSSSSTNTTFRRKQKSKTSENFPETSPASASPPNTEAAWTTSKKNSENHRSPGRRRRKRTLPYQPAPRRPRQEIPGKRRKSLRIRQKRHARRLHRSRPHRSLDPDGRHHRRHRRRRTHQRHLRTLLRREIKEQKPKCQGTNGKTELAALVIPESCTAAAAQKKAMVRFNI